MTSKARNLATLLNNSGLVPLASKVAGVLPDANAPSGSVIQVVQVVKTDAFSTSTVAPNWTDITGLSLNITPSSSSSRILVLATCSLGNNTNVFTYLRLMRDNTPLFLGNAASGRVQPSAMFYMTNDGTIGTATINFVDTPATTSQLTYKLQLASGSSGPVFLNISSRDGAFTSYDTRQASSLIAMEIAA